MHVNMLVKWHRLMLSLIFLILNLGEKLSGRALEIEENENNHVLIQTFRAQLKRFHYTE